MTRSNQRFFGRLKETCSDKWQAYTNHEFVCQIGQGTLPEACFRHYLIQDYLFLIHFARAYALAAYKADTLRRLEEEQGNFEAFLERLREAKDKAEFDQFMNDRAKQDDTPTSA